MRKKVLSLLKTREYSSSKQGCHDGKNGGGWAHYITDKESEKLMLVLSLNTIYSAQKLR